MRELKDYTDEELIEYKKKLEKNITIKNNQQMSMKILMNSSYGAVTNRHLRDFFDVRMGASITATGQVVNRYVARRTSDFINEYLGNKVEKDYVITMDTDSFYATLEDVVKYHGKENLSYNDVCDWMDEWYKEHIDSKLLEWCEEISNYMNAPENRMFYDREKIAISGIFKMKKRYTLAVIDDEGVRYPEPKIKVTGLESVSSSTPKWARNIFKKCYKLALLGTEADIQDFVKTIKDEFNEYPFEKIAQNKKIKVFDEYQCERGFIKGTPSQVKAAISHNRMIEEKGINYIAPIGAGDGVKILMLEKINPTKINDRIAFVDYLPEEFGLEKYIDKNAVWIKSFIDPLQAFLDSIGWNHKKGVNFFKM